MGIMFLLLERYDFPHPSVIVFHNYVHYLPMCAFVVHSTAHMCTDTQTTTRSSFRLITPYLLTDLWTQAPSEQWGRLHQGLPEQI